MVALLLPDDPVDLTVFAEDGNGWLRQALAYKMRNGAPDAAPSLSYVLTIVCGCRDWRIEPDPEVKATLAGRVGGTKNGSQQPRESG